MTSAPAVGFRRARLTEPDAPPPLADTRGYLRLEQQWMRLRVMIRAIDRGGDLAQAAQALGIPHEAALASLPPERARRTLEDRAQRLRTEIDARVDGSPQLSVHRAVTRLGLTAEERAVVGALITIECDVAVMRAVAGGGAERPWFPTLAALGELVGGAADLPQLAQQLLGQAHGGTAFCELSEAEGPLGALAQPLCNAAVRLRPRLRDFLLELDTLPASLGGLIHLPSRPRSERVVASVRELVAGAVDTLRAGMTPWLIGPAGSGRRSAAALIGELFARPVWVVAWSELAQDGYRAELRMRDLELESHLVYPVIMLDWRGPWLPNGLPILTRLMRTLRSPLALSTDEPIAGIAGIAARAVAHRFAMPTPIERAGLIRALLAERGHPAPNDVTVLDLADAFALHPGDMHAIIALCPGDRGAAGLVAGYREQAFAHIHTRLAELAQPVRSRFSWDDLVLDDDARGELRAIIDAVRYRRVLFDDWGMGRLLPYGRGVHAIFSGPPGTGKTMAASVVASTMGRELFRVDVSQLVSKYIGETEKNIGRVFDAAAGTHAVLFFDEADALFARRTEVRSHHDRSANMETGYLLQRMEQHDGVTILATNLIGSIDSAFSRRIPYRVEFARPSVPERTAMWSHLLQAPLPTARIDTERLGAEFELSGAQIKNAVVRAGLRAAAAGRIIDQQDLEWAALIERRIGGATLASPPASPAAPASATAARGKLDDEARAAELAGHRSAALSPDGTLAAIRTHDAVALYGVTAADPLVEIDGDGVVDFDFVGDALWLIDRSGLRRVSVAGAQIGREVASPWPAGAGRLLSPGLPGRGDLAAWATATVGLVRVHNDGRVVITSMPVVHGEPLAVTADGRVLAVQRDALVAISPSGIAARMPLTAPAQPLVAAEIVAAGGFAAVLADDRAGGVQIWDRAGKPLHTVALPETRAAAIGSLGGVAVLATAGNELVRVDLRAGRIQSRAPAGMSVDRLVSDTRGQTVLAIRRAGGKHVLRVFGAGSSAPA